MSTYLVSCRVSIGNLTLRRVHEIRIICSWEDLADTARVKLPLLRGKVDKDNPQRTLADVIQVGQRVEIWLGYEGLSKTYEYKEFSGFVKKVSPKIPLEIECEDALYLLKRVNLSKSWRDTTLQDVVQYIVDQANAASDYTLTLSSAIPNVSFRKFRLDNINGAEALDKIKQQYGLVAYFRDFELFCGLAYTDIAGAVTYNLTSRLAQPPRLTWERGEDKRIKIKAISILKDNTTLEVEVGDAEGEQRTKFYYNITSKANLKELAETDIKSFKIDRYEGDILTFLVPFVQHSMTATLVDPEYELRTGRYQVDRVETTLRRGIRRKVSFGILLGT